MRTTRKPPRRLFRRPPSGATFGGLAVNSAMATWGNDGEKSMLAVVSRIGDARHVPPGYSTTDCHECGRACWISPRVEAMARKLGMRLLATCTRCVKPDWH